MNLETKAFTFLLILSSVAYIISIVHLFSKKDAPGAIYLFWLGIASVIWINGYIFEINLPLLSQKFQATQFQYLLGIPFVPAFCYLAVVQFTSLKRRPDLKEVLLVLIIPFITTILIWTNDSHQLMYENMRLTISGPFIVLDKDWGVWYYIMFFYSYILLSFGILLLINSVRNSEGVFRKQSLLFLLTFIFPIIANMAYSFKLFPWLPTDLTPVSFAFAAIVMGINFQKHGLLDIVPAARETVIDAMNNGLIILDSHKRIIEANSAAKKVFNQSEITGRFAPGLFTEYNMDILSDGRQNPMEVKIGNSVFEISATEIPRNFPEEPGKILYFHDITFRKENEEKLKELNSAKDKLFSIIAHDLKNPLYGLIGLSEMLYEDFNVFDKDEMKKVVKDINDLSSSTYTMLENLLAWSRQQTGLIKYNPKEFDISSLIQKNILNASNQAMLKDIILVSAPMDKTTIVADENMIDTVLRNLISNAIKFTNSGGTVAVSLKITNNQAEVIVKDNGVGMSEDTLQKLFLLESDVKSHGTSGEKGTGLGLLLCKDFIERHKGTIIVESTPGKGTAFSFSIPVRENLVLQESQ
jgi:signal transduction histidine kinase